MTGVLLLCILPEGAVPGMDVANPAAQPTEGLNRSPLTLWIRPAPHAPAPTLEDVRAHHGIVEAAWASFPAVLPVRFGQWFATREDLIAAVEPRVADYARALERVRGAGEFSIRILDAGTGLGAPDAAAEAGGGRSGTAYLRAAAERARQRAAADERGREIAAELRAALGGLVRDARVEPLPSPHGLANVAHLVARNREEEYRAAADRFAAEGVRFLRTGPWPAWSFTE